MPTQQTRRLQRQREFLFVIAAFQPGHGDGQVAKLLAAYTRPHRMFEDMRTQQQHFPAGRADCRQFGSGKMNIIIARMQLHGHAVERENYGAVRRSPGIREKGPGAPEFISGKVQVNVANLANGRIRIIFRGLGPLLDHRMQPGLGKTFQQCALHTGITCIRTGEGLLPGLQDRKQRSGRTLILDQMRDAPKQQPHDGLLASQLQHWFPAR